MSANAKSPVSDRQSTIVDQHQETLVFSPCHYGVDKNLNRYKVSVLWSLIYYLHFEPLPGGGGGTRKSINGLSDHSLEIVR